MVIPQALGASCAAEELDYAASALAADEKNYHAWAHRQWAVAHFGLWAQELAYVESMIRKDVRNNSAWNQRAWLLREAPRAVADGATAGGGDNCAAGSTAAGGDGGRPGPSAATGGAAGSGDSANDDAWRGTLLRRELEYAAAAIQRAPRNESAWNFLWGLFTLPWLPPGAGMGSTPEVYTICAEALADCPSCVPAVDTLAQVYAAAASSAAAGGDPRALQRAVVSGVQALEGLCVMDPMRELYWQHRRQVLEALLPGGGAAGREARSPMAVDA